MAEYTAQEIEKMRQAVAAADRQQAEEEEAKREAYLQPVRALVGSEAFREVQDALQVMRDTYEADDNLSVHVNALAEIMPRLASIAGVSTSLPVAPAPTPSEVSDAE